MSDDLKEGLTELRNEIQRHHLQLGKEMLQVGSGKIYSLDLLAVSVLNRSVNLLFGFCDLIVARNFIAAAPLVRMQLDNLLRFSAAWIVDDPHEFAEKVMQGKHVRNLNDKDGKKMTDRYLLDKLKVQYPWLPNVYRRTSGYVHLSDAHIFNAITKKKGRTYQLKIATGDAYIPEPLYLEAIEAFSDITSVLFSYMRGWIVSKKGDARASSSDQE